MENDREIVLANLERMAKEQPHSPVFFIKHAPDSLFKDNEDVVVGKVRYRVAKPSPGQLIFMENPDLETGVRDLQSASAEIMEHLAPAPPAFASFKDVPSNVSLEFYPSLLPFQAGPAVAAWLEGQSDTKDLQEVLAKLGATFRYSVHAQTAADGSARTSLTAHVESISPPRTLFKLEFSGEPGFPTQDYLASFAMLFR